MSIDAVVGLLYLASIVMFALGLKRLARVRTSRSGNALAAGAMLLAVVGTLVEAGGVDLRWVPLGLAIGAIVGVLTVVRAQATQMPQVVARFNGFGGAASALVALALFWSRVVEVSESQVPADALGAASAATLTASVVVGAVTFAGSVIAELKLRGTIGGAPNVPGRPALMVGLVGGGVVLGGVALFAVGDPVWAAAMVVAVLVASLVAGVLLVAPIGGADMPVVISLLNSLSGIAAAATGFALGNNLLIAVGTLVGAAGLILTGIMCRAMNRSLTAVLIGGFGADAAEGDHDYEGVVASDPEEAGMVLEAAQSVIIVPGFGLAASKAQHAVRDLAAALGERGVRVRFAIHPVAGRMPGHMNVVLAEADVPYDALHEMDEINREFADTDVAIVVGANDVVNPAANEQPGSPIAGMPILNVDQARRVFVVKRSLSPGYAGIKNTLFERDNTVMLYGDGKEVLQALTSELQGARA